MLRVLTVNDEGYTMWNIVVDESIISVTKVKRTIKKLHDGFFNKEDLQIEYGGYYEYVSEQLEKIDGVTIVEGDVLEL